MYLLYLLCIFVVFVLCYHIVYLFFFFFKQKTAYEMRISDWSSDVCSSDLDFFGLLRKYGLNREKAMHIAPEGHAIQAGTEQLTEIFEKASERQLPIMVFTNSAGCVQINTGLVQRLVTAGLWFNVLDPDFNLHLRLYRKSTRLNSSH